MERTSVSDDSAAHSFLASQVGLKWFFVEMLIYGGIIVPALDALSLKLKSTAPSFKKKKGPLPAEIDQVQRLVWNSMKTALKQLQTSIEQQAVLIEASLREHYSEIQVLSSVDNLSFLSEAFISTNYEDIEPVLTTVREKAIEFSREKASCVERVTQMATQVSK